MSDLCPNSPAECPLVTQIRGHITETPAASRYGLPPSRHGTALRSQRRYSLLSLTLHKLLVSIFTSLLGRSLREPAILLFFNPIYYIRPSFLSFLVVTQIRGYIFPPPHHGLILSFLGREYCSPLFTRLPTPNGACPRPTRVCNKRSQKLVLYFRKNQMFATVGFELQHQLSHRYQV